MMSNTKSEASRIVGNLCTMAGYHGTTTSDVVDEICKNFSLFILCHGRGRNIVFTTITSNSIAYKSVPA
jgi:hypothetical protein